MGLDQYLYRIKPDHYTPGDNAEEIAYWRKDWPLQEYINSKNCEDEQITLEVYKDILDNLRVIYSNDEDTYKTKQAFEQALQELQDGYEVTYYGWW